MSKELSAVARTEFDSMVKHEYADVLGVLKKTITVRQNVVGDTYKFRKMGRGIANQKSTADLVTPMDVSHDLQTATLENWNAPEYTDIFDQMEVNFDEKQELAEVVAGAISRREDQIIIDSFDAGTPLASTIVAGGANLTVAKLVDAKVALVDQGVPNTDLFFVANAFGLKGLLNDEKATSEDFAAIKALVQGMVNTFMGFTFNWIETRTEGGLTIAANIVDSYAYHRATNGIAIGKDMSTSIDWIADRTAWLTNGIFKGGAVIRDEGGYVKVQYDQTQ